MSTHVTREEFDGRMRVLEGEVEGEKLVTRYILEQTQRNGDDLTAIKARVDHLSSDVALLRGAVTGHTALLNVLVQDVGQLRQEMGGTRRDVGQLRQDMQRDFGQFRQEMLRDMGQLRQEMHRDIGQFRQEMLRDMGQLRQEMQQDMGQLRQEMQQDMGQLRQEMQRDIGQLSQEMQRDIGQLSQEMGAMRDDVTAIRAALAPRDPPAAIER